MGSKYWKHFVLAWIVMFMSYCLRKPIGLLKISLKEDLSLTEVQLGMLGRDNKFSL